MTHRATSSPDEIQFQVLRRLHQKPDSSQRMLARELNISLGSINYCFQALIAKGWVKMQNFSRNPHKLRYAYLLTPTGIAQKSQLTAEFLKRKLTEYAALQGEIEALRLEVTGSSMPPGRSGVSIGAENT